MTFEELATAIKGLQDQRRIVICEPGMSLKIQALLVRYNVDELWAVRESQHCPEGKLILINELPELDVPGPVVKMM